MVDLGYGASGVTALELHARLARARPDVEVLGLEIEPERVARATEQLAAVRARRDRVRARRACLFARAGSRCRPAPAGARPSSGRSTSCASTTSARCGGAWQHDGRAARAGRCARRGHLRRARPHRDVGGGRMRTRRRRRSPSRCGSRGSSEPSIAAERLPKALIHRNVPRRAHPRVPGGARLSGRVPRRLAPFGPVQRWSRR